MYILCGHNTKKAGHHLSLHYTSTLHLDQALSHYGQGLNATVLPTHSNMKINILL